MMKNRVLAIGFVIAGYGLATVAACSDDPTVPPPKVDASVPRDGSDDAAKDTGTDAKADGSSDAAPDRVLPADAGDSTTGTPLIGVNDVWKYLDNGSDQGTAWQAEAFNDSTWKSGPGGFGYGREVETAAGNVGLRGLPGGYSYGMIGDAAYDGPVTYYPHISDAGFAGTVVTCGVPDSSPGGGLPDGANNCADITKKAITTYFRKKFTVSNAASITALKLGIQYDDGVLVHINGTEILRAGFSGFTGAIPYDRGTSPAYLNRPEEFQVNEFVRLPPNSLHDGENTIAVEIHQQDPNTSSDIHFGLRVTFTTEK